METDAQWFAIQSKPRKEELAMVHLANQGLTAYLPRMKREISHARQRRLEVRPIFPGYLFLSVAPHSANWTAIASTRGVIGPVCFGDQYPPVPDSVIELLRTMEDDQHLIQPDNFYKKRLKPGCSVQVDISEAIEVKGFFCDFNGENNVRVLLDLLNRQVRVTVPMSKVRLA